MGPRDHNRLHWVARYGSVHVVPWTRLGKYLTFSLPLLAARTSRSARAVIRSATITQDERLPFLSSARMQSNSPIVSAASSSIRSPPNELRDGDAAHLVGGGSVWLLEEQRISPRSLARIGTLLPFYSYLPHPCLFRSRLRFCSVCYWSAPAFPMQYVGWEPAVTTRSQPRDLSSFRTCIPIPDWLEFCLSTWRTEVTTMNPITVFLTIACVAVAVALGATGHVYWGVPFVIAAIVIGSALKMANTWEKFVILRAGKLLGVKGPGLFLITPVIDNIVAVIDERIQTTAFSAEQALTKDTVPVNVDAIIFWFVHDAQKAALNITNYREAIDRVAQTSLREMIGASMLSALLSERNAADELLRGEIGRKTADWGISVKSVEIRDVAIPVALQDAMSRQAQAEREKQARVILGSAEAAIAGKFVEAAMTYADHPMALQLRAMNIIYETTKERGATILIPTSMVDSLNPVVALALAGQETASQKANEPLPLINRSH
jgi:regulator of protease activity HflC (stomatin/prohibitin superfamily)